MLDLINTTLYSVLICNGEEGDWSRQCDDKGNFINANGLGNNGQIIWLGLANEGTSWYPIRIMAQDGKKWKVNPLVDKAEEEWILYMVGGKPLECLELDPTEYNWR